MPAVGCGTSQSSAEDVTPQEAVALDQQAQVHGQATAKPAKNLKGLAALVVTAKLSETDAPGFDLEILNQAKKGTTVHIAVESVEAQLGDKVGPVIGWLGDDSPLSRRIMEPSFIDLPAGRAIVAARVNLMADQEWMAQEGVMVSIKLRISGTRNRSRTIELPPIALSSIAGQS